MKKLIAIILVAAMLTTLFAACASKEPAASAAPDKESTAEEKVNVYFIPKNLGNPYFDSMGTGFEEAMEEIGADKFDYTFTGPATAEATSQIEYVDAAVQNGADVIIIDVNSEDALNTTFDEAREAGTTIIVINGDIMGSEEHRDGVIMPCDYGPVGAELIENCGAQIGYKGDFAVLSSTTDAVAQNGWIATMKECLETDEKYKDMQDFFREFSAFAHELAPTKPVALAPNNIDMHLYQDEWKGIMENLDILIPFAFARSENNIPQIAEMCKKWDVHFWVDMEIFKFPFDEGALVPKDFPALLKEIHDYDMLEQVYGYQYTGMLNEPGKNEKHLGGPETEVLYEEFYKYQMKQRGLSE